MAMTNPAMWLPTLREVSLFRGLTRATLIQVAQRSNVVTCSAGMVLVEQGDPGDFLCVIVDGTVEVRRDGRVISHKTAGEYFGEISLIDGEPRSATVIAVDDVTVLKLTSSDFDSLLNIPQVARAALRGLASLFRRVQDAHDLPRD